MPNNPLQNLPQGWEVKTLGEVSKVITGKTPPKSHPEYFKGKIPFVKPSDLDNGIFVYSSEDTLTELGFGYAPFIPKNSILVSCIGNLGKKAILGINGSCNQQINAIVPNQNLDYKFLYYQINIIKNWLEQNASATTVKIINKSKFEKAPIILPPLQTQQKIVAKLESEFAKIEAAKSHLEKVKETIPRLKNSLLKSAFSGELTQPCKDERGLPYRHCEDSSESKAHNLQGFCPHSQIYNAEVPQDSIVESKVCRIVDCHELHCNSRNDESIAQAPNFTRAPNLGGATSVAQNLQSDTNPPNYRFECNEREESRIVDSHRDISHFSNTQYDKKDNLPQGWEMKTLGEVCEIISKGATPKIQKLQKTYNDDVIFLKAENITINGDINFNNAKFIDYKTHTQILKRSILKNNDILITIAGSLARCAIVEKSNEMQINLNQAIAFARLKEYSEADSKFIKSFILSPAVQTLLFSQAKTTAIPNLTLEIIKNLPIPLPPLETQKRIVEILDSKFAALENLEKETNASLEKLQKLKSSLLNLAFKGELI